jgi:hypothetical protein
MPATDVTAEGLASPNWGYTFKIRDGGAGPFQGIYVGAGPYLSMQTSAAVDPALVALWSSPTPVYVPNTSFYMSNETVSQFALAITGGYRGASPGPAASVEDASWKACISAPTTTFSADSSTRTSRPMRGSTPTRRGC